jgi:polar amino acid transport system substrate-binding protein
MKNRNNKLYISIAGGAVLVIALIWLLFGAFSANSLPKDKLFLIARDSTWYPLDLRGKEISMVGFANEMVAAIAADQEFRTRLFEVGPNALFDGLDLKNYDAILSSLTPNVINRQWYVFSDPFYLVGPVLIVNEKSKAKSLEDMEGKIIGIESGALQVFNILEPPNIVIIPYDTASQALENLDNNVIDGVILEALRAYVYTEGFYSGRLKVASSPLTDRGLRLIARNEPGSVHFVSRFNEGLKAIREKGIYADLIEKWELITTD